MKPFRSLYKATNPDYNNYYDSYNTISKDPINLDFQTLVIAPTKEMYANLAGFVPDVLIALYILILGWVVAHILKFIVSSFLKAIHFDKIAEQTGMQELLNAGEKKISASKWFSTLTYWVTIFITWTMALEQLRLRIASNGLNQLMYMVSVIAGAVIVLTLGMFLSVLVARIIETVGTKLNVPRAKMHASIIKWTILMFTLLLTLLQFNIPPEFVFVALCAIFVTLCITFIIAFGIGGREWAHKILNKIC